MATWSPFALTTILPLESTVWAHGALSRRVARYHSGNHVSVAIGDRQADSAWVQRDNWLFHASSSCRLTARYCHQFLFPWRADHCAVTCPAAGNCARSQTKGSATRGLHGSRKAGRDGRPPGPLCLSNPCANHSRPRERSMNRAARARGIAWYCLIIIPALLLVGSVSHGLLRRIVQTALLWARIICGPR